MPATKKSTATKVSVKAQPKAKVTVTTPPKNEESAASTPQKVEVKAKKRNRPRNRPFAEIHEEFTERLKTAYTNLQMVHRSFSTLNTAHKREIHSNRAQRDNSNRTPTTLFDQQLVDYFRNRLDADELKITRKNGDSREEVDLSGLSTETPLYRTDLTQLYTRAFIKHELVDEKDHRKITNYAKDSDLLSLMTADGYDAKLKDEVAKVSAGNFALDIFNIQRFLNHHLRKLEREAAQEAEN